MKTALTKTYAPYEEEYCDDVINIGNSQFGNGYLSKEKLNLLIKSKNIFYLAFANDEVIGYCLFVEENIMEAENILKIDAATIRLYNRGDFAICLTKSMAIDKRYQRNGVARELFEQCYLKCVES